MRILFAISLVALAALLWASVSIAQHIYRTRKQDEHAREHKHKSTSATRIRQRSTGTSTSTPVHDRDTRQHRKAS